MRETSLKLLLHGLGWCALGVVLLYTLIHLGVLAEDFQYKGAVVFTVTVLGVAFSGVRLERSAATGAADEEEQQR